MTTDREGQTSGHMATVDSLIVPCSGAYDGLVDGEAVIFSALDRRLHVLNSTARQTWAAIDGSATGDQVILTVAAEYEMNPGDITADVLGLIDRLVGMGLCHLEVSCEHGIELEESAVSQKSAGDTTMIGSLDEPLDALRALGVPISVETNDALLRSELSRVLSPLRCTDIDLTNPRDISRFQHIVVDAVGAADSVWRVTRNGVSARVCSSREQAIRTVVAECNTAPLLHIDDAIVFHAAAADLGRGSVLMAGVSNAGKSTLVAQLLQRGHEYITDEAAAVDLGSLAVRPFTKSICLEQGAQELFDELPSRSTVSGSAWDVDPRTLGPGRLGAGGPIVAVVFASFDPNASPVLRPLGKLDSLRRLIANAFVFDHVGAPAFEAVVRMANVLPFYELVHAGGTRHLDQLEDLLGDRNALSL